MRLSESVVPDVVIVMPSNHVDRCFEWASPASFFIVVVGAQCAFKTFVTQAFVIFIVGPSSLPDPVGSTLLFLLVRFVLRSC